MRIPPMASARRYAWLIVASAVGAARNPGWYRNLAAPHDQVWIEIPGESALHVAAEQPDGARGDDARPGSPGHTLDTRSTRRRPTGCSPVIRLMPATPACRGVLMLLRL
jgi:F420H(2)-dependent quinone reductase